MAVEYVNRNDHPQLFEDALKFERYLKHPTYHKLDAGMYTDDTQMSIAVSEVLLANKAPEKRDFSNAFFDVFKRDQRDGYSRAFQEILEKAQSADELRSLIVPASDKNGAAMRSIPLGVISDVPKMIHTAANQAMITHATPGGITSSVCIALMSHFALYDERSVSHMYDWCCQHLKSFEFFKEPWEGPVKASNDKQQIGVGMITAHAVHTLVTTKTSLMDIMKQVIEWGGDTDSVAALAWGIASTRLQDEQLPAFFEESLESGRQYGVPFLKDLGQRLMNLKQ